ncbi:VOC family protein [Sedimentimonas flavescens]|uniref:VOC family protein n=1 Tax=Sedimentimonas flavescens TaxID=2851012 RepID=A0ABT2ZUY3_9RHOB|nr:VOC family protein [Sedimentimonas flavescens]MCV2877549.1 VOC family protein [Sedimentimonas flavescens]
MFSHVTLGIADLTRARAFYAPLMELLGLPLRFDSDDEGWIGWQPAEGGRPLFIVTRPFDGRAPTHGNGAMMAFLAPDRAAVDAAYLHALAHGGTDVGAPVCARITTPTITPPISATLTETSSAPSATRRFDVLAASLAISGL